MSNLSDAEIIIIGGGAVGCGVAYSLVGAGKTDVLLIEQMPSLAAATTSQAAGLVGQVRSSVERVKLAMWSVKTFSRLQQESQATPSWRQVGSLRIALTERRVEEFRRLQNIAAEAGLEVESLDQQAAQSKWPAMNFEQAKAELWCPTDGYLQPSDLTMAYAAHCRKAGARLMTSTTVREVLLENGRVQGVVTDQGTVRCRMVINAAGAHAQAIAKSVGLELPIVPVRHEYFVTVPAEGLDPALPCVRIPDETLYLRAEVNALLLGGW